MKDNLLTYKYFNIIFILISVLAITSCHTTKKFADREDLPMSASKIIRKVGNEAPSYNYYDSKKVTIDFIQNNEKNNFAGQFKIKKDNSIIFTMRMLSFTVARAKITPDSIFFVNFYEKSYMELDYDDIRSLFGIPLDYNLIQALLTADLSNMLGSEDFYKDVVPDIQSEMYLITKHIKPEDKHTYSPIKEKMGNHYFNKLIEAGYTDFSFWIDSQSFAVKKLKLNNSENNENISIDFDQFEQIGNSQFPQNVSLNFNNHKQNMLVNLKLSRSSVNTDDDFSFSVPADYEKISGSK